MPESAPSLESNAVAHVVVGTAGHIDHGKSSLVRRLTGHDPDRLPEEKARGITIDLGYAGRALDDGRMLGFIDVPGHERFIRNMVAGATGVDVTILVVAADDGVMPQTREHLAILELLGLKHLLVALTKCDLVDEDMQEMAVEDVREILSSTAFAQAPIVPCSTVTGDGCEDVWVALLSMLAGVSERSRGGIFRMPIQRSFSARGFGTIVTGVPLSGQVSLGDVVEILPPGKRGKIRGLQAYERTLETACAGHRTAINIADVDLKQVERGMVVATPGLLQATSFVAVHLRALPQLELEIADGDMVRFLCGTAETLGEVALLQGEPITGGGEALVQLVLQDPVVAVPGDHYILRRHSPMETLGGGVVLRLDERRLKRRRDWILHDLALRRRVVGDPRAFLTFLLEQADDHCVTPAELVREVAITPKQAAELVAVEVEAGRAIEVAPGKLATRATLERARTDTLARLERFHAEHPEQFQLDQAVLKRELGLDDALIERALADLGASGQVVSGQGACRLANPPAPSAKLAAEREQVVAIYRERTFESPRSTSLAEELGWQEGHTRENLQYLADSGVLVKIADDLYLHSETVAETLIKLRQVITEGGEVDTGEFKNQLNVSRKLLIPLLEYFDASGVTIREGNKRFLRSSRR